MGLHRHRKLTEEEICHDSCYYYVDCSSEPSCKNCIKQCLSQSPPIPPFVSSDADHNHTKHSKISTYLIITFAVIAAAFFVLCGYAIYAKLLSPRRRTTSSPRQQPPPHEEEFLDEEHGPTVVDHPIWYIRTTGLHQSIISAIAVCKYKRGEGLIEGTECSVCLGEFQEDESLRLLPKCNHAFHLPCIDTWLRSHTNCPMCRAPIVSNPARVLSMEPNTLDSSSLEDGERVESLEGSGMEENIGGGGGGSEEQEEVEVEGGGHDVAIDVQPRRSVSLDSCSAAKISAVAASVEECRGNSERVVVDAKGTSSSSSRTRYLQSAPGSMKRSRSFNGKHLVSWYSRGQKKPTNAPVRSF